VVHNFGFTVDFLALLGSVSFPSLWLLVDKVAIAVLLFGRVVWLELSLYLFRITITLLKYF
jgi:hypothetical protein